MRALENGTFYRYPSLGFPPVFFDLGGGFIFSVLRTLIRPTRGRRLVIWVRVWCGIMCSVSCLSLVSRGDSLPQPGSFLRSRFISNQTLHPTSLHVDAFADPSSLFKTQFALAVLYVLIFLCALRISTVATLLAARCYRARGNMVFGGTAHPPPFHSTRRVVSAADAF